MIKFITVLTELVKLLGPLIDLIMKSIKEKQVRDLVVELKNAKTEGEKSVVAAKIAQYLHANK